LFLLRDPPFCLPPLRGALCGFAREAAGPACLALFPDTGCVLPLLREAAGFGGATRACFTLPGGAFDETPRF
jgi:hypothetical protein